MVKYCCVPNCQSEEGDEGVSFHRFPKEKALQTQWLHKLRIGKKISFLSTRVCCKHFAREDYRVLEGYTYKRKVLRAGALPTQNLPKSSVHISSNEVLICELACLLAERNTIQQEIVKQQEDAIREEQRRNETERLKKQIEETEMLQPIEFATAIQLEEEEKIEQQKKQEARIQREREEEINKQKELEFKTMISINMADFNLTSPCEIPSMHWPQEEVYDDVTTLLKCMEEKISQQSLQIAKLTKQLEEKEVLIQKANKDRKLYAEMLAQQQRENGATIKEIEKLLDTSFSLQKLRCSDGCQLHQT